MGCLSNSPLFFPSFNEPFSLAHHPKKKKKKTPKTFEAHRNFYVTLKRLSIGNLMKTHWEQQKSNGPRTLPHKGEK
jgi:hypothetical protein